MKATYEKLPLSQGQSFRCFDRRINRLPSRWHRHPEIELTFVPKGDGSRQIGDHLGTYTDSDLVLIGPNLPHTWASDEYRGEKFDMHEGIVTQFDPDFLGANFFSQAEMQPIGELLKRSERGLWFPPEFALTVRPNLYRMSILEGPQRLICLLETLNMLQSCDGAVELATVGYVGPTTSARESRMQIVFDYSQANFTDPTLNTGQLAEKINMNPSAFCRFFKQSTGITPTAYINELRIGFACRRLLDSDRSILDICHDSGFSSTSNFNGTFRKLRNMSPRQYRNQHIKIQSSTLS